MRMMFAVGSLNRARSKIVVAGRLRELDGPAPPTPPRRPPAGPRRGRPARAPAAAGSIMLAAGTAPAERGSARPATPEGGGRRSLGERARHLRPPPVADGPVHLGAVQRPARHAPRGLGRTNLAPGRTVRGHRPGVRRGVAQRGTAPGRSPPSAGAAEYLEHLIDQVLGNRSDILAGGRFQFRGGRSAVPIRTGRTGCSCRGRPGPPA